MQHEQVHKLIMIALIAVLAGMAFGFQGARGIYAPDEGYYSGIAEGMLDTGDWLIPRLNFTPWLEKPPLSQWGIAGGMWLFGHNEFGARLFHGLCFVLTTLLIVALGRALWGKREGLLAGVVYATMAIPFAAANVITPDTPLTLWTTAAIYCFWMSVRPDARRSILWKMLMCVAFGLGFLTKGPAVLIPSGALFVFLVLQRRALRFFLTPWALVGLGLFAALGVGWYAYVARELPGALAYFLDNEVFGRTISAKYSRNPGLMGALTVYPPVILLGSLPWLFVWCRALWQNRKEIAGRSWWSSLRKDPPALLIAVWIAVPLMILILASSKLPLYALPMFPAMALATSRILVSRIRPEDNSRTWLPGLSLKATAALGVWVLALLGLKLGAAYYPTDRDMRALNSMIEDYLPGSPLEIVGVNLQIEGLGFYREDLSEQVTVNAVSHPLFVSMEQLGEEIEEIPQSLYTHVLITRRERRAEVIRNQLEAEGVSYREIPLSMQRYLFVCDAAKSSTDCVRLAALGDAGKGKGKSRQYSVAGTFQRLYEAWGFRDGVLLLGDNFYGDEGDQANLRALVRRQFEEPFAFLTDQGIPCYAVLGNHDLAFGLQDFELNYTLFHMQGRRYYSQVFGDHLVEAFMLDSNTLQSEEGDNEQVEWLKKALETSQATWKIVVLHHPIYSSAQKFPGTPSLIERLEPLLISHGVSLVLQGHNHLYERLDPIRGITYVTAGSAGEVRIGNLDPDSSLRAAGDDESLVILLLEFTPERCHLKAYDSMEKVVDDATFAPRRSPSGHSSA